MPSYRFLNFLQTATRMTWFMLAMIAYPDVQKKCQEELDRVIGRSRTPTFKDRESLPYMRATLREVFRWRSTGPVGEHLPSCSIHCIHRELGETGLQHYTTGVTLSRHPLHTRRYQTPRMTGMKDFLFPRERGVLQTYGMTFHFISSNSRNVIPFLRCVNREKTVY